MRVKLLHFTKSAKIMLVLLLAVSICLMGSIATVATVYAQGNADSGKAPLNAPKDVSDTSIGNNVTGDFGAEYTRPAMGDEVIYPTGAAIDREKSWYEYIEYATNKSDDIQIVDEEDESKNYSIYVYYPLDFDLATVMTVEPLVMKTHTESGSFQSTGYITETSDFSSASSVNVTYQVSSGATKDFSNSFSTSIGFDIKEDIDAILVDVSITSKLSLQTTNTFKDSASLTETRSLSRTFAAIPNPDGTIAPWRVVQYTVQIPVKLDIFDEAGTLVNSGYYLLNMMTGTCREWATGHIEHWNTGEKVSLADFYGEFLTDDKVKEAYQNNNRLYN